MLLSAARCSLSFSAEHISDVHNQIADVLSRICWQEFRRLAPAASPPALVRIDHLSLEQRCHAFLVHGLAPSSRKTTQRKVFNLFLLFFNISWASFIPLGRLFQLMNGFCVCLQLFWRDLATIRLLRSICRASALFMLSRGFQIHYKTVCFYNGLFEGLNALKVLRRLIVCPSLISRCCSSGNP